MASWKRARTADRDAAVDLINAAYTDGQITLAEREDKVGRALSARTMGEVQQTTADLQRPELDASAPAAPARPAKRPRALRLGVAAAALLVAGGTAVALDGQEDDAETTAQYESPLQVTVNATLVEDLLAVYESTYSTTRSFGFIVHPLWVRVRVPTEDDNARYVQWTLVDEGELGKPEDPRGAGDVLEFDIARVDVEALAETIDKAQADLGVEDPTRVAVEIQHWRQDEEPTINVTVSNAYEESGYLVTDLYGDVLTEAPYETP